MVSTPVVTQETQDSMKAEIQPLERQAMSAARTYTSTEGFAEERWAKDRQRLTSIPRVPSARYRYPCVSLQPSTRFARLECSLLQVHADQALYFLVP